MDFQNSEGEQSNEGRIYIRKQKMLTDPFALSDFEQMNVTEGATVIHCYYESPEKYINGGWINISPTTYLMNTLTNTMLPLIQAHNIPISPQRHYFKKVKEKKTFTLFFPLLPQNWKSFSMVELVNAPDPIMIHDISRNATGVYHAILN
jgi:hypothetical protein